LFSQHCRFLDLIYIDEFIITNSTQINQETGFLLLEAIALLLSASKKPGFSAYFWLGDKAGLKKPGFSPGAIALLLSASKKPGFSAYFWLGGKDSLKKPGFCHLQKPKRWVIIKSSRLDSMVRGQQVVQNWQSP